ncbi:MAG: hypothetical protein OXL96_07800 [Candidatus Poribacteria bacterium]|nr:hypothetical protein [Candidatus Poribacteria bacterium]
MRDFHSEHYPKLKQVLRKIGQDLSTPDFQVTLYSLTGSRETQLGSKYAFKINVISPDKEPEEVERYAAEKDWQKMIIEKMCEYYPDATEVEGGVYIPEIGGIIPIPDTIFSYLK